MFTIDYIAKDMGFTIPFVRKCLKQMDGIFKNCYKKGEFNRIYFNQNGMFSNLKYMKRKNLYKELQWLMSKQSAENPLKE
jgi:hypothetical protein